MIDTLSSATIPRLTLKLAGADNFGDIKRPVVVLDYKIDRMSIGVELMEKITGNIAHKKMNILSSQKFMFHTITHINKYNTFTNAYNNRANI